MNVQIRSSENRGSNRPMRGGPMGGPGGHAGMMKGEKARDFKGTMGKLIAYLGKYKGAILIVFVFAIASTAANIVGPKILGNVTGIDQRIAV